MAFNINQRLNGLDPLAYAGVNAVQPPDFVTKPRPPTPTDSKNFSLGQIWLDTGTNTPPTANDIYMLVALLGNQATWVSLSGGNLETLTGNSGGAVGPDGASNVNVVGDGVGITITGVPGTHTLTASLVGGGIASQTFLTDSGTAVPTAAGALTIWANNASLGSGSSVKFSGAANAVLLNVTDANNNTIIGNNAGNLTLTATNNVFLGKSVGHAVINSSNNVCLGYLSGVALTSGTGSNTFVGSSTGTAVTSGVKNCLLGNLAGSNLTGIESNNVLICDNGVANVSGLIAVSIPTEGDFIHNYPGVPASTNGYNTFVGLDSGNFTMNVAAIGNVGIGSQAISALTTGVSNVTVGDGVAFRITSGSNNTILGRDGAQNSSLGTGLITGSNNVMIGYHVGRNYTGAETGNILIGANVTGIVGEIDTTHIGLEGTQTTCFIAGIRGKTTTNADAIAVLIDSAGQLGTVSSSRRYKENINDMGSYSDVLRQLRPVTFNYKKHSPESISVGLIAEEVAEVAPQLVVYDKDGQPETVKYLDLPIMMLNEQQQHCRLIAQQQAIIADLMNRVKLLEEDLIKRSCC